MMKKQAVFFSAVLTVIVTNLLFCIAANAQPRYPQTVNISYVPTPFNLQIMVMKERRMLEQAFAPLGVDIRWYTINSGAAQAMAMAAGSLDIAPVINSASVILANAAGNPVEIAALVSRPRQTFALMVGPKGPRNIKELRGKTVAGPKGSVLHQMLIAALVKEGMKASDIKFIQMDMPEARSALLANRVDAALQTSSLIIRNEEAGMRTLFTADGYLTPLLFTAVRPAFAKNYPELLRIYLDVQGKAYDWISANTTEAVAIGSRIHQVSMEDGMKLYRWSGLARMMEAEDIASLEADVEFLYQQNMIERKINPRTFILPSAFNK
ncbi:MAG: NrtA/SsuA/CpmA family ABC transporter substrate-binding protein [Spirochaetaceae bacterium]|jgi:ABC-type nitrate/sulfonate/bicarbonate transport system substrate-binding protein|nr:NrtA/SsuA/CpmA family ABC transporter substrate-binding protein [Spirochaetaceae bacterium]